MTKKISTANLTLQPLGKAYIAYIIMDTCNYFISIYRLPSVSVRMLCLCEAGCCWLSWLHILTSLAAYLLPFHFCHFSNLPLIWHYFSFDIERERAVSSLSALQLLRVEKKQFIFSWPVSRAIVNDALKTHKDKKYLVWLSTHGGEEWNDEVNEEGHHRGHQER